jgi:hypothetical protein
VNPRLRALHLTGAEAMTATLKEAKPRNSISKGDVSRAKIKKSERLTLLAGIH